MTDQKDVENLLELIDWTRDKLERLGGHTRGEFLLRNLRAVARGLDPATNPRLRAVVQRQQAQEEPSVHTERQERIVGAYREFMDKGKRERGESQ